MIIHDESLQNYLSLLGNDPITELLNSSQLHHLQDFTLENDKCLSAVSPILNRSLDVMTMGDMDLKAIAHHICDAIYPAPLVALRLSGKDLRIWLEMSASIYQQPNDRSSMLLCKDALTFLFYPIAGLDYEINIDQSPLYDQFGDLNDEVFMNESKRRIGSIRYKGKEVLDQEEFTLITNRYAPFLTRAYWQGNTFLEIGSTNNHEALRDYLEYTASQEIRLTSTYLAEISWHWHLTSRMKKSLFLPIPVKDFSISPLLLRSYRMVVQAEEPSGYDIYFHSINS